MKHRFSDFVAFVFLFALATVTFSNTLVGTAFIRDDRYIVTNNPLLQSWNSIPKLITTGYWEGAVGAEAPVQEFRPLLMLSYAITAQFFGFVPWIFHLGNLLLHAVNVLLLFLILKRHYPYWTAFGAGALFAVLPIHSEAVAYISGRSELVFATFLLLAWLELDKAKPRILIGLLLFCCALASKEQAVLFPIVLAAGDWVFHGRLFWRKNQRPLYLSLSLCVLAYLVARCAILADPFHGGSNYFAGRSYLVRLLTMSRFALEHYTWPALTGLGLQSEFVRPFFPDASVANLTAWFVLASWAALFSFALSQLIRRRSRWAFWTLAAFVWILPVSNLIVSLDTIGAERFLYLPSIGLCIGVAQLAFFFLREPRYPAIALAMLITWYGTLTFHRNRVWATDFAYYRQAIQDNSRSAGAHSGFGVELLNEGKLPEAERSFQIAAALNPSYAPAHYNLGKIYFERGDWAKSETFFREALARGSKSADAWLFLGLLEEKRGKLQNAANRYQTALKLQPWHILVHFNLGRVYLIQGRIAQAKEQFELFLSLAPNDPDAPRIRSLLTQIKN